MQILVVACKSATNPANPASGGCCQKKILITLQKDNFIHKSLLATNNAYCLLAMASTWKFCKQPQRFAKMQQDLHKIQESAQKGKFGETGRASARFQPDFRKKSNGGPFKPRNAHLLPLLSTTRISSLNKHRSVR